MPIIAFTNLKGGVAKTTTAVAVAESLALAGYKTLMIDADHQCMAGELLLGHRRSEECENRKQTLHDLFLKLHDDDFTTEKFWGFVQHEASTIDHGLPTLSVLPCSTRIDDFETNLAKSGRLLKSKNELNGMLKSRMNRMQRWINKNFDFTIIDCPPSMPFQVKHFLNISHYFVLPCVPDRLSIRGSRLLIERIALSGRKVQPLGTIWSLYRKQNTFHRNVVESDLTSFSHLPRPFKTIIPNATAIADSTDPEFCPRTFREKYSPYFARIFHSLTEEIVNRSGYNAVPESLELVTS